MACEVLRERFYDLRWYQRLACLGHGMDAAYLQRRLDDAFREANSRMCDCDQCRAGEPGMGTTLSALVIRPPEAVLAHVGDSRIYLLREGRLRQLTRDDTFINELVECGEITVDEARRNPLRHVLEQAIGQGFNQVFTSALELRPGDRFLLCTDGLHDMVPDDAIEDILKGGVPLDSICGQLQEAALAAGGRDNVSIIVVEWKE